jgi:hypothetical protein
MKSPSNEYILIKDLKNKTKQKTKGQASEAHTYNPSYS